MCFLSFSDISKGKIRWSDAGLPYIIMKTTTWAGETEIPTSSVDLEVSAWNQSCKS